VVWVVWEEWITKLLHTLVNKRRDVMTLPPLCCFVLPVGNILPVKMVTPFINMSFPLSWEPSGGVVSSLREHCSAKSKLKQPIFGGGVVSLRVH